MGYSPEMIAEQGIIPGKEWWTVGEIQQRVLNDHPDLDTFRDQNFVGGYLQTLVRDSGGNGTPTRMDEEGRFHQEVVLALIMEVEAELGDGEEMLPEVAESVDDWAAKWVIEAGLSSDSLGLYFRQMAKEPLLTAEEEIDLGRRIKAGEEARKRLAMLGESEDGRVVLKRKIEEGQEAREHLARANTRFVVSIAKRYMGQGLPFSDLIQEGNIGLMLAVDKYDYTRGNRFDTYAGWWIRQTITRAISQKGRTIRIPKHLDEQLKAAFKAGLILEQELGRRPKREEIMDRVGLTEDQMGAVEYVLSQQVWELDAPAGIEGGELRESIPSEEPEPAEVVASLLLTETIGNLLDQLTPRQAQILRLRFGLGGRKPLSLEKVGEKFGLSRERIRQLEKEALRRLRQPEFEAKFCGYFNKKKQSA